MGSSLKNYRDSLKRKWLKPYGDAIEEARANVPPGIVKDDWNDLVDWWTNEDYMVPLHIIILCIGYCHS